VRRACREQQQTEIRRLTEEHAGVLEREKGLHRAQVLPLACHRLPPRYFYLRSSASSSSRSRVSYVWVCSPQRWSYVLRFVVRTMYG
jgi:hypothetical protein